MQNYAKYLYCIQIKSGSSYNMPSNIDAKELTAFFRKNALQKVNKIWPSKLFFTLNELSVVVNFNNVIKNI